MPRLTDTSPEAERVLAEVYRRMSPERKLRILEEEIRRTRRLHEQGYRLRHPGASPGEVRRAWVAAMVGRVPMPPVEESDHMDLPSEHLDTVRDVVTTLDRLGIPYVLGGSVASTVHGEPRQTRDADLSVDPFPGREAEFAGSFAEHYYLSEDAVRAAIRDRSSFNVINTETGFKVDIFVHKGRPFDRSIMARGIASPYPGLEGHPVRLVSPEDIVLLKLEWYRLGGETSDRQWGDVLGVLRVQGERLDAGYLDRWAAELGVADLLDRARAEAAS